MMMPILFFISLASSLKMSFTGPTAPTAPTAPTFTHRAMIIESKYNMATATRATGATDVAVVAADAGDVAIFAAIDAALAAAHASGSVTVTVGFLV